jgi:hypothetical protein
VPPSRRALGKVRFDVGPPEQTPAGLCPLHRQPPGIGKLTDTPRGEPQLARRLVRGKQYVCHLRLSTMTQTTDARLAVQV